MRLLILLAIGFAVFSACSTTLDLDENNTTRDADGNVSTLQKKLTKNKKLWKEQQPNDYSFVVFKSCFCPHEEKILTNVHNSAILDTKYIPSNTPMDNEYSRRTIDDFFDIIQDALDKNASKLSVIYNETYGYPVEISIDYDEMIVDEEIYYTIEHFTPLVDGGAVCTQEYAPVCAKVDIQCITQPCKSIEQTFSNKCMQNANPNATYLRDGEC